MVATTVKEKEGTSRRSSETGAETDIAMTLSMAEEANAFSVGDNRTCSDGRSREDKHGSSKGAGTECEGFS